MRGFNTPLAVRTALAGAAAVVLMNCMAAGLWPGSGSVPVRWSAEEFDQLASLRLAALPATPRDPSNAVEASTAAIALGQRLFSDPRFSRNGAVSCASCHDPARQFQDGLAVSRGLGTGTRRAMPVVGAGHSPWLFWDGRKDSLWSQALGPLEDALEHGGNRLRYARLMQQHYGKEYAQLFGTLPDFGALPQDASPLGTATEQAAWQGMDEASREQVSRVFANLGKAIAAYEKSLQPEPTRLDRYLDALVQGEARQTGLLDAQEIRGLRLFIGKGQCIGCHNGPLFTDQHFHNTGVPQRDPAKPDRGRAAALAKVRGDEFNCLGRFSDARAEQCEELRFLVEQDASLEAAFKTPGLRGVALRPPYMHAGQIASLEEVVRHYVAAPHAGVGHSELSHLHDKAPVKPRAHGEREPILLSTTEQQDLVAFLRTLSPVGATGLGAR
ncbi:cytochrome c peroxidase [Pelomonas sp. SE-A7]|uniref:cytochrome-c peroxidase n=1 Tax=Pelomonas sp. SE-A7 TaxID=3054953 RepID=UPI00259CDEC7|nr:cytochrome c peroxidase [Pelomonas sp. SE-A7]MDM4765219.1 cytochrome c peroxidase [Pelomonas sp. SE-A7]